MQRESLRRFNQPAVVLLLLAVCYLFFFYGLGKIGLLGPDEPRYAGVAREMYNTGDYVTPRLYGEPWFEKPPLTYWSSALGFAVFGVTEFGARFGSAAGAAVCVFLTYFVCNRLWGRRIAIWAALILATSTGFFAFSRAASTDMPLTVCLTVALLCFLAANSAGEPDRRWWFYGFYVFLGLGVLAKGPIAWVLPGIALLVFLIQRGGLSAWKQWHPEGILLSLAVALPWYVAATAANGSQLLETFLIEHNFQRFTTTTHGHGQPFYYYGPTLLLLTFPWTFLLLPSLRRALDRLDWVLIWWAAVPVIFFSLSGSKLPGYILPAIPALALLSARAVTVQASPVFRIAVMLEAAFMVLLGVTFGFFSHLLDIDPHVNGMWIAAVLFSLAALLVAAAFWLRPDFVAGLNLLAVTAVVVVAISFVLPRFDLTDTMRPWGDSSQHVLPKSETVYIYKPARWMFYGIQFYRQNNMREISSPEELVYVTKMQPRVFVLAEDRVLPELGRITNVKLDIVRTVGKHTGLWAAQVPSNAP